MTKNSSETGSTMMGVGGTVVSGGEVRQSGMGKSPMTKASGLEGVKSDAFSPSIGGDTWSVSGHCKETKGKQLMETN